MLEIKNLSVSIEEKIILKNITYSFKKGNVYVIMGPNGSGKSTLASAVMGHPLYKLDHVSKILFQKEEIQDMSPELRAQKVIFMSFQSPLSLSGVTVYQLLRYPLSGKMDPLKIRNSVKAYAKQLHIKEELLSRSLNEGFSGGERKKMEILQAAMLQPKLLILDEIDTGVDVDALKRISQVINDLKSPDRTIILITHYSRILNHVHPDTVLVISDGQIVAEGKKNLALEIEKKGYSAVIKS